MALMNQVLFERLKLDGWDVEKLDTSPQISFNPVFSKLSRIKIFFSIWGYLLNNDLTGSRVCLALSGGWGQVYDFVTVLLCRIKGARCVLHHHSVVYLDKWQIITALLFLAAGRKAVHIVLCQSMKNNLQKKYKCREVVLLSNIALSAHRDLQKKRNRLKTIGFLSNVTREKGGWEIIELADEIHKRGLPLKCKVAGPCLDSGLRHALHNAHQRGVLEWTGPVFESAKLNFWNSLDAFIFPTRNEAEPLVVWEALLAGIPVIAYDRGCISVQVGDAGKIIPKDDNFVESALQQIGLWLRDPKLYKSCLQSIKRRRMVAVSSAENQWEEYIANLKAI
jgi:glycosyltransferase involved in cell wall biosynthesis